jgi:hypothetical protein
MYSTIEAKARIVKAGKTFLIKKIFITNLSKTNISKAAWVAQIRGLVYYLYVLKQDCSLDSQSGFCFFLFLLSLDCSVKGIC